MLNKSSIGSAADIIGLIVSIIIFLYAIMKMRSNLKKIGNTTVNEWFIMVHLINFGVYTLLWAIFQSLYYASRYIEYNDEDPSEQLKDIKIQYWSSMFANIQFAFATYLDTFVLYLILRFTRDEEAMTED